MGRLVQSADDIGEWSEALLNGAAATVATADGHHDEALELWNALIVAVDKRSLVLAPTDGRIGATRSALAVGDGNRDDELLAAATESAQELRANLVLDRIEGLRIDGTAAIAS